MRNGPNVFRLILGALALPLLLPSAAPAAEGAEVVLQQGEDQWVPSFAIVSGITIQSDKGSGDSVLFEDGSTTSIPLRGLVNGSDVGVQPFVGGSLEVMSPALDLPGRPRFFLNGEVLPTFGNDHAVAVEGDPGCIRSPLLNSPCASDLTELTPASFEEDAANGSGTKVTALVEPWFFGLNLGSAFPVKFGKRQLRIRPSIGWILYEVRSEGFVSDAECGEFPGFSPPNRCLPTQNFPGDPINPGFLRETTLKANDTKMFNGIGPGLEVEMDVGRYGPLGVSLLAGARAYAVLGDRKMTYSTSQAFDDFLGNDIATATFEAEVNPWIYRANIGIRFQWLGKLE